MKHSYTTATRAIFAFMVAMMLIAYAVQFFTT